MNSMNYEEAYSTLHALRDAGYDNIIISSDHHRGGQWSVCRDKGKDQIQRLSDEQINSMIESPRLPTQ